MATTSSSPKWSTIVLLTANASFLTTMLCLVFVPILRTTTNLVVIIIFIVALVVWIGLLSMLSGVIFTKIRDDNEELAYRDELRESNRWHEQNERERYKLYELFDTDQTNSV